MKSSKLPVQAAPVVRTIPTASAEQHTHANGVLPSIMAPPLDFCAGSNSPMCQMWRSGQLRF